VFCEKKTNIFFLIKLSFLNVEKCAHILNVLPSYPFFNPAAADLVYFQQLCCKNHAVITLLLGYYVEQHIAIYSANSKDHISSLKYTSS